MCWGAPHPLLDGDSPTKLRGGGASIQSSVITDGLGGPLSPTLLSTPHPHSPVTAPFLVLVGFPLLSSKPVLPELKMKVDGLKLPVAH